ncbi:MAG: PGF-pre-PGF domain-containing protein [Candidatus Woesearchaeota archaeon]
MVARATSIVLFLVLLGSVAAMPSPVYDSFTLSASSVSVATLDFVVNTSWLVEHDLREDEVVLYREVGGEWVALPTTVLEKSSNQVTLQARAQGFSSFIIAASQTQTPVLEEPVSISIPEESTLIAFAVFIVVLAVVLSIYFVSSTQEIQPKNSFITSIKAIDPAKRRFEVCLQEFEKAVQKRDYSLASSLYHVARSAYLEASVHEDPFWVAVAHKHVEDAYRLLEKRG